MNQLWRTLKIGFATTGLALVFTAACGDNTPPQTPEPPPPTTPSGCCQLADKCVLVDDPAACEARGGEHMENASCADNQCIQN